MAIKRFQLAKEGPKEDPAQKRIKSLDDQIKQAQEQLKLAKETDSKSDRAFNLQQRVNTLKGQKDQLKKRTDDKKEREKESKDEAGAYVGNGMRCKCIKSACTHAKTACKLHGKVDCKSTMCPESPNFNALTQI